MIVRLTADAAPEISDCDRVDRLSATAAGALTDMMLEPTCRVADDDHIWVRIAALRNSCEPVAGSEPFEATIAYATSKGWVDPTGQYVRAHVEPADD